MTEPSITLEPAGSKGIDRVEAVLAANDLPNGDVRAKPECFYLARSDAAVVGVGGLEPHGENGLLRSVVIGESNRGRGYGAALCDALEARASEEGVGTLYLLTTTAAGFFRGRGYEALDRAAVPSAVRGTTEFTDLCPASATCMRKPLDR
ncbi:arsenic resistance N-acetyltransferase ArsN2 [Halorarum halobium]|uniref:arsenic resistance N-acetyltransferase ArsN2 n=1 Tax=Halorarum halobium TaxID=3075121 RepID=UPI0028A85B22|nr:arsenic resistance N-acetyltransferase ArsN2 [Halobaculum sp. XH14]